MVVGGRIGEVKRIGLFSLGVSWVKEHRISKWLAKGGGLLCCRVSGTM